MATFKGTVTWMSEEQNGTSKAGKAWRRVDAELTYDTTRPEWPKAVLFSVMNDNIGQFGLRTGGEYEVEVDFSTREYQGRRYMSATCWRATAVQAAAPQPAAVVPEAPMPEAAAEGEELPF